MVSRAHTTCDYINLLVKDLISHGVVQTQPVTHKIIH